MAPEVIAGICGIALAVAGQLNGGYDVFLADAVICGLCGIFGAFAFSNTMGMLRDLHKIISILIGAGFASIFGPIASAYAEYQLEWVRPFGYLNDAATGTIIGLLSTPLVAFVRNPIPAITAAMALLPVLSFGKKRDKTDV